MHKCLIPMFYASKKSFNPTSQFKTFTRTILLKKTCICINLRLKDKKTYIDNMILHYYMIFTFKNDMNVVHYLFCISVDPEPDSDPSKLQNKTNLPTTSSSSINKSGPVPPPIPPRTNQSHHVTTTYITQDEVTISSSSTTVSASSSAGGGATGSTSGGGPGATTLAGPESSNSSGGSIQIAVVSNDPKKKNEILKLRDMLLTDNSVESS